MNEIKAMLYGIGAMGSMIAKYLLAKEGIEIVGAVDIARDKVGEDLGTVLNTNERIGINITDDVDSVLCEAKPDIALLITSSFLRDTYPQIASIVEHGVDVVSTCEELSYPFLTDKMHAKKIDALAKKNGSTVLGTGINPGFLMDTLVITLTSVCEKIEKIESIRVMDAASRRVSFQKKIGVGLTVEEFRQKLTRGEISGHIGLEQSIAMIADALAWKLDAIVPDTVAPILAEKRITSAPEVEVGKVGGLRQKAIGVSGNKEVIALDFRAYAGAEQEYDSITIKGVPTFTQKIQPCIHGDIGTVAMIVNSIPKVINAPPGLLTMKDLPISSAALGDIREHLGPQKWLQS